jgi:hypothetical protein
MRAKLILAAAAATLLAGCVPEDGYGPGYGPGPYAGVGCPPGLRLDAYGDCVRYRPRYSAVVVAPEPIYVGPPRYRRPYDGYRRPYDGFRRPYVERRDDWGPRRRW